MSAPYPAAVGKAALRRVVLLSGTSVRLGANGGSGTGAAIAERHLDGLDIPERVYLRGGFMENHLNFGFVDQAATGSYATPFRPDFATPMVAAADIGRIAADALTEPAFTQPRVRELLGAKDYTMAQATLILGSAIGRPDLRYVQIPLEQARRDMLKAGMSASFIDAVLETARTFNDGIPWAGEARSPRNTTPTTLTLFADQGRPGRSPDRHRASPPERYSPACSSDRGSVRRRRRGPAASHLSPQLAMTMSRSANSIPFAAKRYPWRGR